jgi:arsenate reductase
MAEGWWRYLAGDRWDVCSAGAAPAGQVHPLAVAVMAEAGVDISTQVSQSLDGYREQHFDLVITVCDAAATACPIFPGRGERLHWPFEDPPAAARVEADPLTAFRRVRDAIRERIEAYLASWPASQHASPVRSG